MGFANAESKHIEVLNMALYDGIRLVFILNSVKILYSLEI